MVLRLECFKFSPTSQGKTKGMDSKIDIGVKYADKQMRHFDDDKIKAGQCVIGLQVMRDNDVPSSHHHRIKKTALVGGTCGNGCVFIQMGTNKCASQAGMTAYGTRRHLYDPKTQTDKPYDQTTISLQMGTNKGASQVD